MYKRCLNSGHIETLDNWHADNSFNHAEQGMVIFTSQTKKSSEMLLLISKDVLICCDARLTGCARKPLFTDLKNAKKFFRGVSEFNQVFLSYEVLPGHV